MGIENEFEPSRRKLHEAALEFEAEEARLANQLAYKRGMLHKDLDEFVRAEKEAAHEFEKKIRMALEHEYQSRMEDFYRALRNMEQGFEALDRMTGAKCESVIRADKEFLHNFITMQKSRAEAMGHEEEEKEITDALKSHSAYLAHLKEENEANTAKQNADAAAYMAEVVAKSAAAAKASADADAANDEAQAKYAATKKEIAAAGEDADEATKQRLAQEKAAAEATAAALEKAKADLDTAKADLAKAKKDNEEKLAKIAEDYNSKTAALKAKLDADEEAFKKEAKEHAAAVADELKNNALNAKAAQAEIAQEAADDKAAAAAEHDAIDKKYAEKKAAQDAAKAAWQAKADDDAKMAHAADLQADADKAHQAYEDDVAAGEHEQDEADAMTKAELGYGNEIEECATGTQCLDATDMKCKDLGTEFCIAEDQFSCAPVPASGECNEFGAAVGAGLDTYNVAPALTVAPIGRPTRKCIKHIRGARKAIPGGILSSIMKWDPEKTELPMTEFFCGHDDL